MRPLNSDELGEKGEQRFAELCADAKLTCNKASRDRSGWDFLVEFPFEPPTLLQSLDRRPQPPDCRVQVKTVWTDQTNIKLRLSSAERLAKLLQPTCICVLTVSDALEVQSLYVIHILDEVLETILRETRKCQARDGTLVNKEFIRSRFRTCTKELAATGAALRHAFAEISGTDRVAYIKHKQDQIDNLGATGNIFTGSFSIKAESDSELVDIMLGYKIGNLTAFTANETRWNIALPIAAFDGAGAGTIRVIPTPAEAELTIRDTRSGETATLDVGVILPGPPGTFHPRDVKVRIVNQWLEMSIPEHNESGFSVTTTFDTKDPVSLSDLITVNKIYRLVFSESGFIELRRKRRKVLAGEFSTHCEPGVREGFAFTSQILSELQTIVAKAGGDPHKLKLDIGHIDTQLGTIQFVHALIVNPTSMTVDPIVIKPLGPLPSDLKTAEMLAIGRITMSNHAIAFCVLGTCRLDHNVGTVTLSMSDLSLREVAVLDTDAESFAEFNREMQDNTGVRLVVRWEGGANVRVRQ
jgi:hypothetical protein